MKTNTILSKTIAPAVAILLCGAALHAQTATFVNTGTTADGAGELFVAFHATANQGVGESIVIDLGAVSTYAAVPIGGTLNFSAAPGHNVGSDLSTAFGSTWYNRTDLLWSAVSGVQSTVPSTSTDFTSTLYGSVANPTYNSGVGPSGTAWNRSTNGTQNPIAQNIVQNMATGTGGFTSAPQGATSNIAVESSSLGNNYATWMPGGANVSGSGNTPFKGFGATGFEQTFGSTTLPSGVEGALDVFRMDRSNATDPEASPTTGTGPGSYQFTLTIDVNGNISGAVLPVPEPASICLLVTGGLLFLVSRRRGTGASTATVG